jgi:membrane protease YdiL (CAAX protease family)
MVRQKTPLEAGFAYTRSPREVQVAETFSMSESNTLEGSKRNQEDGYQPESAWRLVAAAVGSILLALVGIAVAGFLTGAVGALLHLEKAVYVLGSAYAGVFGAAGVLLAVAMIQGRLVGSGDISVGLGNKPVSRLPTIACLAVVVIAYAVLLDFVLPGFNLFAARDRAPATLWIASLNILRFAIVDPLAEESLFRGWLWTGLRKHWSALSTALLTSILWLALHVGLPTIKLVALIPVAIILAMARHFGRSLRAPLALHAIHNLVTLTTPWLWNV